MSKTPDKPKTKLPRSIWALGFVSMFMDISSEMIHALLPVFLVTALGASTATVGLIEGIGEATASITKLFSGWVSDRLGKRKLLAVIGYGLATLTKPFFAMAGSPGVVMGARIADRIGKGIRGAPRDALVADITPESQRGAAYGLRQSLDTVGAFAGPLLAIGLMVLFADNFRSVFWVALIPGAIAVAILVLAVKEPEHKTPANKARLRIDRRELRELGGPYLRVVLVGTILTLARFSEAFLILRAEGNGLSLALVPVVLVVLNVVYAVSAYPAGVLSDRTDKRGILLAGFGVLILADVVLASSTGLTGVFIGIALWGLHMGLTQGLLAALVSETAPERLRGTAFGIFHLLTGLALLAASLLAGVLWDAIGPSATFVTGAGFAATGLLVFILIGKTRA